MVFQRRGKGRSKKWPVDNPVDGCNNIKAKRKFKPIREKNNGILGTTEPRPAPHKETPPA